MPICLFAYLNSHAQYKLNINFCDTVNPETQKLLSYKKEFRDSLSRGKEIQKIIENFRSEGFLAAGFDSLQKDSTKLTACLHTGEKYTWLKLGAGNVDEGILRSSGFSEKIFSGQIVDYKRASKFMEKILVWCENNGYPFASVRLDSISIDGGNITTQLNLSRNKLIRIDSVVVYGSAKIAPVYLYSYLSIKPGSIYNESLIRDIRSRLKEIAFVNEIKPYTIVFTEDKARIELFLESKRASQFDLVVGLVPPPENTPGKYELTGDAHLKLINSFARGEIMELNWKKPEPLSQDLKVRFNYPFLFSTPFGIDLFLSIFKKDTTYLDITRDIGIQYIIHGNNSLKAFVSIKESNLLSTATFQYFTTLPSFADISTTQYGLALHAEHLDYRLNPRKGFSLDAEARIGDKVIHKNADLNPAIYDSLKLRSTQYHALLQADYYFPLAKQSVITAGVKSAYQYSPVIFSNERFRIGGLKTLRGFDEESINATLYAIGNIEYRFLLEQNSYLLAFVNQAYFRDQSRNTIIRSGTPLGFGGGITFETRLGIFSFIYALGRENNQVLLRNGKIHFGLISTF
ncbi:MAG TPA: BamA/TamA family outer membrane protein [Bacteroidia bacterium]|nr:BamA/TamA family outer membrane protein [Bacteroidia bacterium]